MMLNACPSPLRKREVEQVGRKLIRPGEGRMLALWAAASNADAPAVTRQLPPNGSTTSAVAQQHRTAMQAWRRREPWSAEEVAQLALCDDADALEAFARRWGRTYAAVEQRRKRPRMTATAVPSVVETR